MTSMTQRLSENLAKLGAQLDLFTVTLNRLEEVINGTAKTGGLKERIAIAEEDIKKNKESFLAINKNITDLRTEMLIEVGKISTAVHDSAKKKSEFSKDLWQSVIKVALATITAGVVGVAFWQLVLWLAAHAPVR
jgi:chromosome segregation ATPase